VSRGQGCIMEKVIKIQGRLDVSYKESELANPTQIKKGQTEVVLSCKKKESFPSTN